MKNRLSRRKKLIGIGIGVLSAVGATGAWGYLTTFGNGTAEATVTATGPIVAPNIDTGQLRPDRLDAITVEVTNPLNRAISVTQIPVGTSRGYSTTADGFECVAGSVTAGAQENGLIVPSGDGVNVVPDQYGATTIPAGQSAEFRLWAKFDTVNFPSDNQDGCLGKTLELNFGPVKYVDAD